MVWCVDDVNISHKNLDVVINIFDEFKKYFGNLQIERGKDVLSLEHKYR